MAAPAFGTIGTHINGSSGTASFAVPASVAANDIIVIPIFLDSTATITAMASGFAHAADSPATVVGGGGHSLAVVWKRATGADSGTYDFTLSATAYRAGSAARYTGAVTSGDPWDVTNSASDTGLATVTPAVSDTTTVADTLLIFAGSNWSGGTWTPPASFTERMDTGDGVHTLADLAQPTAGATGSITATCTGSDRRCAWLGALKSVAGGGGSAWTYGFDIRIG